MNKYLHKYVDVCIMAVLEYVNINISIINFKFELFYVHVIPPKIWFHIY